VNYSFKLVVYFGFLDNFWISPDIFIGEKPEVRSQGGSILYYSPIPLHSTCST